jgi:thioredoxin 1
VDRNKQAAQSLGVQSIPTLMLFKEGKALWRHSGVVGASVLEEIIHKGGVTV